MESYFLTIGTYGSRLPGDPRGTLSRKGKRIGANPGLHAVMSELSSEAVHFDLETRAFLFDRIISFGYDFKIAVDAANVRTEHLHVILSPLYPMTSEKCAHILKRKLTVALRSRREFADVPQIWARSYYCATLTSYDAWYNRLCYTLFEQGDNSYLNLTKFGKRKLPDLEERTVRESFVPRNIQAYRKRTLTKETERVIHVREFED